MRDNAELKQRMRMLEEENAALREQIPRQHPDGMDEDTARVLTHLFRAEGDARDVGITARMLQIEKGVVKYHLDQLKEAGLAISAGGNYVSGHVYWSLTPAGRKYAIEKKLIR